MDQYMRQRAPAPASHALKEQPLDSEAAMLRQAADIATHVFETQMIIIQPKYSVFWPNADAIRSAFEWLHTIRGGHLADHNGK